MRPMACLTRETEWTIELTLPAVFKLARALQRFHCLIRKRTYCRDGSENSPASNGRSTIAKEQWGNIRTSRDWK